MEEGARTPRSGADEMEGKMSSCIRNTLNAGIAALAIGTAVITLAPSPALAFSFGGLGHMGGGFGHMGGGNVGSLGHTENLGHTSIGRHLGGPGHGANGFASNQHQASPFAKTGSDKPLVRKTGSDSVGKVQGFDKPNTDDGLKHTVDRLDGGDEPPVFVPVYSGEQVIGDDPKPGPTTLEKAKVAACKWVPVKVSVTNYGTSVTDKEKKEWRVKFEKSVVDYAKQFVKDNASKLGKTILKAIIEDTTITRTMDVLITYACVDANNDVLETKVVGPIEDQYAMHWWTGAKLNEGNERDKAAAIAKNRPTTTVTAKK